MALAAHSLEGGEVIKIDMPARFSFDIHSELRKVYVDNKKVKSFIVDLSQTTFLDSSALGMLLQLREHAGYKIDSVRVINAKGNVREILKVADFGQMVMIE